MLLIKVWYHFMAIIQTWLLKLLYGKSLLIGKKVTWRRNFSVMKASTAKIEIGDNCFFNNDCSIAANNFVKIGNGVLFGENVKIYDHNHRFNRNVPIKKQGFSNGQVSIGDDCWIGSNAVILKGAHISNHCVIGAGCIVDEYIPEWTIVKANNKSECQISCTINYK